MKIYFYIIMFSLGLLFVSCTNVILNEKNDVDNIGNKNSDKSPNPNSQMHDLINLSEYSESQRKSLLQSASNKASKRVLQIELNLTDRYGLMDRKKIIRNSPYTLIYLYADWWAECVKSKPSVRKLESDLNEEKILIYSLSTETKIGRDFSIFFRNTSIPATYLINNDGEIMNKWKTSPNQEHAKVLKKSLRE